MACEKIKLTLFSLLISSALFAAQSNMPPFVTKQENNNLRFLTIDGKYTYYQSLSGTLYLSFNYLAGELIKGEKGGHYEIFSTPTRKKLAITQDNTFHSELNLRKLKNIFVTDWGSRESKKIGVGITPRLHLDDTWISFYNPNNYTLTLLNLEGGLPPVEIVLAAKITPAPYFIPEVIMLKDRSFLYTDMNNRGIQGIIYYDRVTKESKPIYKAKSSASTLELCQNGNSIFISHIDHQEERPSSEILEVKDSAIDFSKAITHYQSKLADLGHLECNVSPNELYFIQNQKQTDGKERFELVEYSMKTKSIKSLSDLFNVAQYFNLDGRLLILHQGLFYLAKGPNSESTDNFIEKEKEEKK